jgi:hypothetical protein
VAKTTIRNNPTNNNMKTEKEASNSETQLLIPKTAIINISIDEEKAQPSTSQNRLPSLAEDALDTVKLGLPIFIARLSFVGVSTRLCASFSFKRCVALLLIRTVLSFAF